MSDCTHSSRGHTDPYSCRSGCTVFYCPNLIVKLSHLNREKKNTSQISTILWRHSILIYTIASSLTQCSALVWRRCGILPLSCSLICRLWFQCRELRSLSSRIIRYVVWIISSKPPGSAVVDVELLLDIQAHYRTGRDQYVQLMHHNLAWNTCFSVIHI